MAHLNRIIDTPLKNFLLSAEGRLNEKGEYNGIKFSFKPSSSSTIYKKSDGEVNSFLPDDMNLELDAKGTQILLSLLAEPLSTYLFSLRKDLPGGGDIHTTLGTSDDCPYFAKVFVTKHYYKTKMGGRDKVVIDLIEKESGESIVSLPMRKKDVSLVFTIVSRMIQSLTDSGVMVVPTSFLDSETKEVMVKKSAPVVVVDNSVSFNQVWLHGQEMFDLSYIVHSLLFDNNIENETAKICLERRQLKSSFESGLLFLTLKKKDKYNSDVFSDEISTPTLVKVPLTCKLLVFLYSMLSTEALKHKDYSETGDINPVVTAGAKYHISLRESYLGFAVRQSKKDSHVSKVMMYAYTKEGVFGDTGNETIPYFDENGIQRDVPIIEEMKIDLRDFWYKLMSHLSIAYTGSYIENKEVTEFGDHQHKTLFYTFDSEKGVGKIRYQFTLLSSSANKAPMVLIVDKYKVNSGSVPDQLLGRYRQPLFRKYIYQMLKIFQALAAEVSELNFSLAIKQKKDLLPLSFSSATKLAATKVNPDIYYGIHRQGVRIWIGMVQLKKDQKPHDIESKDLLDNLTLLSVQDAEMLNISAEFRLLWGYWLPFVGKHITIGQDGYLTDTSVEMLLEDGVKGSDWASKLYFGTTV